MDGAPVEARSLGSIVNLASNPPAYPRNPTQKPLEPLVLYIVRVPGSKDVFLSPLKPPTKSSLSPESLNASLYFLHVAGPRDEEILESIAQERHTQQQVKKPIRQTSKFAILNRTRRKPVPGVDAYNAQDEVPPPLPPRPQQITGQDAGTTFEGEPEDLASGSITPVREHSPVLGPPGLWEPQPPILPPRPLPGPPITLDDSRRWSSQISSSIPVVEPPPQDWQTQASGTVVRASWDGGERERPLFQPESATRPQSHRGFLQYLPDNEGPKPPLPLRPKKSHERPQDAVPAPPFHLTLIRRDPTHSSQWNVGTIDNIGSSPAEGTADGSIKVEITTPGYQKFAIDTSRMSFESLGIKLPAAARSLDIARPPLHSMPPMPREAEDISDPGLEAGPVKFTRILKLSPPPHSSHHRHQSSSHSEMFNLSSPKAGKYPHKWNAHYHFTSIWNGHCNFTTATNGRTLKCKHTIPGPAGSSPSSSASTTVAEIRFNLPTLLPRPSSSGDQNSSPTKSSWIGELDLSLARERAGGGLRGNSAKLGKLIIEDEGLKMLDLVVASCMGVFWKYYDSM
ncbi:hypothetical protein McanMca71_000789 [Microsporum canis]|uniref:Uncharacterized protein n=1 Tax=Arthroderma otae (strain ATCC MYA-4605 / CBS 113480) TaxID=554155 RepID=C5FLD3_ARTOC|nr:conserved hypothetical protein [Microsporum canis CBS 113480]EEQ30505.1 conserved hypothetical protein [Microsporum canis CBS 113480]